MYESEQCVSINLRIRKTATFQELTELIASTTRYAAEQFRVWPMAGRTNNTMRPKALEWETDAGKTVAEVADSCNPWICFLELLPADCGQDSLPTFQQDRQVLLFFKYYDPVNRQIHYAGHHYAQIKRPLADLVPVLLHRAGLTPHTQLELYEEVIQSVAIYILRMEITIIYLFIYSFIHLFIFVDNNPIVLIFNFIC